MTKQEFAIRLLFWLMPWPLSKALPSILRRILLGPAGPTPHQWAQAVYDILVKFLSDSTDYAQQLFTIISDIPPTDQLTTLAAALTMAFEDANRLLATLTEMMPHLEDYTLEHIWQAFMDTITAMGDLVLAMNTLYAAMYEIPAPPPEEPPLPPPELPPLPELPALVTEEEYIAPVSDTYAPAPDQFLTTPITYSPQPTPTLQPWFYDDFDIIDTAVWTDASVGTGVASIDNAKLKLYSNANGHYARLQSVLDDTIPSAFIWTFELTFDSGPGFTNFLIYTGIVGFRVIFDPPTTLRFRQADGLFKDITVDNFLGTTPETWKFDFDGTLCDIYRNGTLIDSDLTVVALTTQTGRRDLQTNNVSTIHIDDYTITPK